MAEPEYNENGPSITKLKSHDLMHIFRYLSYDDLLQCRLVSTNWYQIIKHEARLIDRFRYGLTFDAGSVISPEQPPFSIVIESKIKLKRITMKEDFLERGNSIAVVEANRSKLAELSDILRSVKATNTITEMIVHAKDNEPRTNALLFEMIREMANLRILRFTLTAFVDSLETLNLNADGSLVPCKSLEHVQIIHTDCKRLILADFNRLLAIFPNVKRIDVTTYEAMLLGEDILQNFSHLIKSIEKLEWYTLIDLADIQNLSLKHISYECCADEIEDVTALSEFLNDHNEIETFNLKLFHASKELFTQPRHELIDLYLTTSRKSETDECIELKDVLLCAPNLKKFSVKCRIGLHQFGHQVVAMKQLSDVTMNRFVLDCEQCFVTALKSFANVRTLKLVRHDEISVRQLNLLSVHLKQLQSLELMFDDSVELENRFAHWPAMPQLKALIVNRVGNLTNKAIRNLQQSCPNLEVIKFYSLRGSTISSQLQLVIQSFPNLDTITFRGGRCPNKLHFDYIHGKVGWRLKELDISADILPSSIMQLFKHNNFLETVRCKYGAVVVTRRIYYEVEILKAYTMESIQQPLKNRKRLHMYNDMSSDSETSASEASSSGSSYQTVGDDEDDD